MKIFFYLLLMLSGLNSFAQSNIFSEASNEGGALILQNPSKIDYGSAHRWVLYNMTGPYGNSLQFWNYNKDVDRYGPKLIIADNGNISVGARRDPNAKLTLEMSNSDSNGGIKMYGYTYPSDVNYWSETQFAMQYNGLFRNVIDSNGNSYFNGGNVGIGTSTPEAKLNIVNKAQDSNGDTFVLGGLSTGANLRMGYNANYTWIQAHGGQPLRINELGNDLILNLTGGSVGIGTSTPREKLSVNGNIRSREVKVEAVNWPDYVFEEDYKVSSLENLEKYIKENKHLPEVPSAKEIADNGLELGEMNKTLLKKVEELTLYLIEQNKTLTEQKSQITNQQKMLEKQQRDIEELKKAK
ncbi:hypothetical protein LPB248_11680 [Flavobacterium sp. LPB0248]|uniref:hypothetical protein n=1 Tax=Flavobacterium sp. LPB0248 TaxID=2614441 RepID=UPI0015A5CB05|nr:hypothetical protein [Flavobacterium sp. LPB0248]QLC66929.1 hypothetical protein LPB248_11680 [Flavobacterium sp. LPB0248]